MGVVVKLNSVLKRLTKKSVRLFSQPQLYLVSSIGMQKKRLQQGAVFVILTILDKSATYIDFNTKSEDKAV